MSDNIVQMAAAQRPPAKPNITESDAALLIHTSYVMHIKTQHCTSCACTERFNAMFEVWTHPTKTRTTGLNVLRAVLGLQLKDLEIAYIELPSVNIPLCSECVNTFVHPNRVSTIGIASRAAWAETLRRKYTPEPKAAEGPSSKPAHVPTLGEL